MAHPSSLPVMVKTAALPAVFCPPPAGAAGCWASETSGGGTQSRFIGPLGRLLGFALTGDAQARKTQLARKIEPLLA